MNSAAVHSHRAIIVAAFAETASVLFAIDAMLAHRSSQLKMPRPDAYDLISLKAEDLQSLSATAVTELAARMLAELKVRAARGQRDTQAIRFKDAKIEKSIESAASRGRRVQPSPHPRES